MHALRFSASSSCDSRMSWVRISQSLRFLLIFAVVSILVFSLPLVHKRAKLKFVTRSIVPRLEICSENGDLPKTARKVNITSRIPSLSKPSCLHSNLSFLAASIDPPTCPIPKVIHWIYKSTDIPEQYIAFVRKCQKLNQDHQFIFWSDQSAMAFVKAKYPGHYYLFEKHFTSGLEFSDALRYFILHYFGGVYLDLDVECRRPFTESLKPYNCVLDRERDVQTHIYWNIPFFAMNSVMACQRNHPFFEQATDLLKESAIKEKGVLARTGPDFLTSHFKKFNQSALGKTRRVVVAPYSVFSPLMDENHLPIFIRICQEPGPKKGLRAAACEEFKKNGYSHGNVAALTKNSIAIHRFLHLGWGSWKFKIKTLVSVCKEARVYIYKA